MNEESIMRGERTEINGKYKITEGLNIKVGTGKGTKDLNT